MVKNPPAMRETWVQSLGCEDPLEEGMSTHFSILVWRICMDRGAWWEAVYGVAQSWTQLKRLSSSSRSSLVAQAVKNLPVIGETWVQSLGCEDSLEEGMATHSSVVAWRIPMDKGAKSWTQLRS